MAADDDLDALEAQLEHYEDDEDEDDLPAVKRIWKKYKVLVVVAAAFLIFIPVVLVSTGGSNKDERKLVVVPELAPEPGKQIKVTPDQPGGAQVPGQDKGVFNVVADGENEGKIAITAPPEAPKDPSADGKTPDAAETPIAMVPEGAEKTPTDSKNTEAALLPPPMPPEKDGDTAVLPVPTAPAAPVAGDGKTAENILPAAPAAPATPAAKAPQNQTAAVTPPSPPEAPKATMTPENNNQIAVVIPKAAPAATVTPAAPPSGDTNATPMRTMAGVYRVQVASARSESAAKSLWDKQVSKHPDLLGKLPLTVQQAVIQDRGTFYRVQGGAFGDRESADSICRKLKSRGQDCIVVRP